MEPKRENAHHLQSAPPQLEGAAERSSTPVNPLRRVGASSKPEPLWHTGCTKLPQNPQQQGVIGMDALTLLKKDHSTVKSLFSKFDHTNKTAYDKRDEIFGQVRRELQLHSRAEEEIFYPAIKALN